MRARRSIHMTPQTDLRRHPRYPLGAPIQVSWMDRRGFQWQDDGSCLDTSEGGLKMELPRAVPVNAWINVSVPWLGLNNSVLVRHCTHHEWKYVIGVAFQKTPSEVLRAAPVLIAGERQAHEQDPPWKNGFTIAQPPDDDVRKYLQALKARKPRRIASTEARRRVWFRVVLVVWIAVGVVFCLTLPKLLRYATATYQHPLLQKASALVEAVVNYGQKKR